MSYTMKLGLTLNNTADFSVVHLWGSGFRATEH